MARHRGRLVKFYDLLRNEVFPFPLTPTDVASWPMRCCINPAERLCDQPPGLPSASLDLIKAGVTQQVVDPEQYGIFRIDYLDKPLSIKSGLSPVD